MNPVNRLDEDTAVPVDAVTVLGLCLDPGVNVLHLNLALDGAAP